IPGYGLGSVRIVEPDADLTEGGHPERDAAFNKLQLAHAGEFVHTEGHTPLADTHVAEQWDTVHIHPHVHEARPTRECKIHLQHVADVLRDVANGCQARPAKAAHVLDIAEGCQAFLVLEERGGVRLKEAGELDLGKAGSPFEILDLDDIRGAAPARKNIKQWIWRAVVLLGHGCRLTK